jgi:hypothetical protein
MYVVLNAADGATSLGNSWVVFPGGVDPSAVATTLSAEISSAAQLTIFLNEPDWAQPL